jgi:hypothetical protein
MEPDEPELDIATRSFRIAAWALALLLIALGIWALGGAIYVAWGLFDRPQSIGRFAAYFLETTQIATHMPDGSEGAAHLLSWFFVILLLLLLGKLGDWAISTGARLLPLAGWSRRE